MQCEECNTAFQKAGKQPNGMQKLYCRVCKKYRQERYLYTAYEKDIDGLIERMVKEKISVRGISRVLGVSINTITKRIKERQGDR